jgi:GR25 family glycosyltransferase involved in LPS biosynthesis
MRYFCIAMKDNNTSMRGLENLRLSTNKEIEHFPAVPTDVVYDRLNELELQWKYPWEGVDHDLSLGLTKTAYPTKVREARISCALSHYLLWSVCFMSDQPIIILEHDAIFTRQIDFKPEDVFFDILGLNDPRGATRKSRVYHDAIQTHSDRKFTAVPTIDDPTVPQGLAGNSAYMLKPDGAKNLIRTAQIYGLWPNDALMCKQMIPNMGVATHYYTRIQGLPSTTT